MMHNNRHLIQSERHSNNCRGLKKMNDGREEEFSLDIYQQKIEQDYRLETEMPTPENTTIKRKPRAVSSFLNKTYEILENPINYHAIKWAPDGIGFIIVEQEKFSKQILPHYFKHSNYSSFLNMYNFHKIRESNYESHFRHQSFREDKKELLSQIRRKPEKKKRKNEYSQDEMKSQVQVRQKQPKEQKVQQTKAKTDNSNEKKGFVDTRHVCVSEKEQQGEGSKQKVQVQNFIPSENEDDKISINNQLVDGIARYSAKQIFSASSNNIYSFPIRGPVSHFNIFY